MESIRIVGVDPALRNFGYAQAIVDLDTLEIKIEKLHLSQPAMADKVTRKTVRKNSDDLRRSRHLHKDLELMTKGVQIAMVEVPVGSQSSRAMASYGICIGLLASVRCPMIEVTPSEVKLMSVGKKTATKQEMIEWAMDAYPDAGWKMRKSKGVLVPMNDNEHLADAVAAIYAGVTTEQFAASVEMMRSMAAVA
ncbi:MAG: hypothetical protein HRT93_10800 [Piscirickettsiaceae bacterium]|nr:hypothetical protein [Piscirickettsiaceae bacterium]